MDQHEDLKNLCQIFVNGVTNQDSLNWHKDMRTLLELLIERDNLEALEKGIYQV